MQQRSDGTLVVFRKRGEFGLHERADPCSDLGG